MECHRCKDAGKVASGGFGRTRFGQTPCAKCRLRESSKRTLEADVERPLLSPWLGGTDCSLPLADADGEDSEGCLPVEVLTELVGRLMSLPRDVRDVVCLRFGGMEYKEIARRQRITAAGAEARHERALVLFPELQELFIGKTARHNRRRPDAGGSGVRVARRQWRFMVPQGNDHLGG